MYEGEMMKRALIKSRNRAQLQKLTTANLAGKLLNILRYHIGFENAITKADLFKEVFKKVDDDSLEDWIRWEFLKKAMHLLRVRSKCFVAGTNDNRTWKYFVVQTVDDANHYIAVLDNNIRKMRIMQKRALQAANEEWWRLPDWTPKRMLR
jgi:hypothetical protein